MMEAAETLKRKRIVSFVFLILNIGASQTTRHKVIGSSSPCYMLLALVEGTICDN